MTGLGVIEGYVGQGIQEYMTLMIRQWHSVSSVCMDMRSLHVSWKKHFAKKDIFSCNYLY